MNRVLNATALSVFCTAILLGVFTNRSVALENEGTPSEEIPPSVLEKYQALQKSAYESSLGVTIRSCKREGRIVYVVSGSGGFTGENFYYDDMGQAMGSYHWDDVIEPNEPLPPVDLSKYECTVLKKSPANIRWGSKGRSGVQEQE